MGTSVANQFKRRLGMGAVGKKRSAERVEEATESFRKVLDSLTNEASASREAAQPLGPGSEAEADIRGCRSLRRARCDAEEEASDARGGDARGAVALLRVQGLHTRGWLVRSAPLHLRVAGKGRETEG